MSPLPAPLHVALGILAGCLALEAWALWARRGGAGRLVAGVLLAALAADGVRVLAWRWSETGTRAPGWLPLALVGTLFLVRARRRWPPDPSRPGPASTAGDDS